MTMNMRDVAAKAILIPQASLWGFHSYDVLVGDLSVQWCEWVTKRPV